MKTRHLFFIGIAMAFLFVSCYEDKGNYEYKDLTKITIEKEDSYFVNYGNEITIEPVINFSKDGADMNLRYEWKLEGKVIGNECNLTWVADFYTKQKSGNLVLDVYDVDNDIHYMQAFTLEVGYPYEGDGFLVLAQKEGNICLHRLQDYNGNTEWIPFMNLYEKENDEKLPNNAFKIHEHYRQIDRYIYNQIMIVSPEQTVEIEAPTFKKQSETIQQAFGGALPNGMILTDVHYMQWMDLARDQDGQIYTRMKSTNELFNSDYFLHEPLKFNDEILTQVDIVPVNYVSTTFCLLNDNNKGRFLLMWDFMDDFWGEYAIGKVIEITSKMSDVTWPSGADIEIPKVEKVHEKYDILHLESYKLDKYSQKVYCSCILKDRKTGGLYHYSFGLEQSYGSAAINFVVGERDGNKVVDADIKDLSGSIVSFETADLIYTLPYVTVGFAETERTRYITLIADGNNLYAYNRALPVGPNNPYLWHTFNSNVTAMNAETYQSKNLAIGLSDGSFLVYDTSDIKYGGTEDLIWKSEGINLGTPVDIFYSQKNPGFNWD